MASATKVRYLATRTDSAVNAATAASSAKSAPGRSCRRAIASSGDEESSGPNVASISPTSVAGFRNQGSSPQALHGTFASVSATSPTFPP